MYLQDKRCSYDDIDCHFVVCQKCYWAATIYKQRNNKTIVSCPICSGKNISLFSILAHDIDVAQ
jgi:hypothetical protein